MFPGTWRECATWLLTCEGYHLDGSASGDDVLTWHGRRDEAAFIACAMRPPAGWQLGEEDVQQVAALAGGMPGQHVVLLTTALPTLEAVREAERLGVRLLARQEVATLLARLATAHQRTRDEALADQRARAEAATATRRALLAALKAHEAALARPGRSKAASARSTIAAATREMTEAQQVAARALLAWDTLVTEWQAAFGERPARDGTLSIELEPSGFADLTRRGQHLSEVMTQALSRIRRTPTDGEAGYGEWRRQVQEELARRCEALRLRVQAIDPSQWQDFTCAQDLEAEAAAMRAHTSAERAAARADQLFAQLANGVGLATWP